MTNTELIQAIRNEIERLKSSSNQLDYKNAVGFNWALDDVLSFLNTFAEVDKHPKNALAPSKECDQGLREPLESEKPTNQEEQEEQEYHQHFDSDC